MNTQTTQPAARRSQRPIVIVMAVVGGIALLGIGTVAVLSFAGSRDSEAQGDSTVAVDGVRSIEVEAGRGDFTVEFAEIEEARLEVRGGDRWSMDRDGDELVVKSREGLFDWGFDLCFGTCGDRGATLTLPADLSGLDADLSLGAGSLTADGAFGELQLDIGAGRAVVTGSARTVEADISAGRMDAELADVREASFDVSAGRGDVRLAGEPPREIEAKVSAGSLEIALPDVVYAVDSDVSAGSIDNRLRTDPSAANRVTAEVSAGSLALRPTR